MSVCLNILITWRTRDIFYLHKIRKQAFVFQRANTASAEATDGGGSWGAGGVKVEKRKATLSRKQCSFCALKKEHSIHTFRM